jgi:L-ascorbate metabolism protein UlaG (beta-lactamase superfamily)
MEIVWLGHACFRIRGREATVVCDPCPPSTGYSYGKPTADIVTISCDDPGHTYTKGIAGKPVVLENPGEYEISGAFITGIPTDNTGGEKGDKSANGRNISFVIEMEDIKVVHLGGLDHTPTAEQVEDMVGCDVLLVPVGGKKTLDGAKAAEVVALLEAKLVVPMHYKTDAHDGGLDTADRFLKEMQVTSVEPQVKLQINKSAIPSEAQVVMLNYKGQSD